MRLLILTASLIVGVVIARPQPGPFAPKNAPLIPPGFEEHLPEDAKQKLIEYHFDKSLNFEQRRDKIEAVLDGLPKETLQKLPLPPGLERLPEEKKAKFKELHMNREINWRERQQLVKEAVKELPEHEQRLVEPPRPMGGFNGVPPMMPPQNFMGFPPHPPPGFEVLAPTIYKQLLAVHSDQNLSNDEKKAKIDQIMSKVPQDQLDQLPLPMGFDRLSPENQLRVRQLMHNFNVDWEARHESVKQFIRDLPREQRRLLAPPPPPDFEKIPEETQDQIYELFLDEKLSPMERQMRVHQLIMKLPAEIRDKLPPPPRFPPFAPFRPEPQQQ